MPFLFLLLPLTAEHNISPPPPSPWLSGGRGEDLPALIHLTSPPTPWKQRSGLKSFTVAKQPSWRVHLQEKLRTVVIYFWISHGHGDTREGRGKWGESRDNSHQNPFLNGWTREDKCHPSSFNLSIAGCKRLVESPLPGQFVWQGGGRKRAHNAPCCHRASAGFE